MRELQFVYTNCILILRRQPSVERALQTAQRAAIGQKGEMTTADWTKEEHVTSVNDAHWLLVSCWFCARVSSYAVSSTFSGRQDWFGVFWVLSSSGRE